MKGTVSLVCLSLVIAIGCSSNQPTSQKDQENGQKEEQRKPDTVSISSIPETKLVPFEFDKVALVVSKPKPLIPGVSIARIRSEYNVYSDEDICDEYTDMIIPQGLVVSKGDRVRVTMVQMLSKVLAYQKRPDDVLVHSIHPVHYGDPDNYRCFHYIYVATEVVK